MAHKASRILLTFLAAAALPYAAAAEPDNAFYEHSMMYMDNLKTCTPYTFAYPNPMDPSSTSKNIIKGKEGDHCLVEFLLPNNMKMECSFSPAAITALTSEQKYDEARKHEMSGSSEDNASQFMTQECKSFMNGNPL
ncbi:MAG TPA: hypothetical protein VFT64_07970 [Rickettsiales bacterium]|nr:hypothetical protein [Rickettsiales bacterium]